MGEREAKTVATDGGTAAPAADAGDKRGQMVGIKALRQKRAAQAYRRMLSDKFDKFDGTVNQACLIFEDAFRNEKRPKDPDFWSSFVVDTLISEINAAVTAEFKVEYKLLQKLSQWAQGAAKKGGKAQKGTDDFEVINTIVTDVRLFAHSLVHEAKAEIATIPDDVAAKNYKVYDAKVNSPEVDAAAEGDPTGQDVRAAVQDEILESQGAPITGASEAEVIAVRMLRAVKAEMVNLAASPQDTHARVDEVLSNPAGKEIPAAEKRLNMDSDIYNDQKARQRAEPIVKGSNS